jgi:5-methylcytosine-specific restriction enzyme subunit McrC
MLRPDLWIDTPNKSFIADTKYKITYSDSNDPKSGISQSDIYQMMAYAMRFNVSEIKLLYPNTVNTQTLGSKEIIVLDALAGDSPINITAYQVPVIDLELMRSPMSSQIKLSELFEKTRGELKRALELCFKD